MDRSEEAALVQRAVAGEEAAITELMDYLTPHVLGVARRFVPAWCRHTGVDDYREARLELFQEVMVRLFAKDQLALRRFDPERASLGTYVRQVARNTCYTLTVDRAAPPTEALPEEPAAPPVTGPQVEARLLLERLHDALVQALTPSDLRLFQLMVVQELPFDDVSRETGFTKSYLYVRKHRLRTTAHALLEQLTAESAPEEAAG